LEAINIPVQPSDCVSLTPPGGQLNIAKTETTTTSTLLVPATDESSPQEKESASSRDTEEKETLRLHFHKETSKTQNPTQNGDPLSTPGDLAYGKVKVEFSSHKSTGNPTSKGSPSLDDSNIGK
jgi:hypothetical protein